jgi:hypothetical protein
MLEAAMAAAQITSERIDDIPLLMQWLFDMHIAQIIDAVLNTPHGNRQGLSYGQLAVVCCQESPDAVPAMCGQCVPT